MDIEKRNCLECKQVLHGRADKKFCSDYCRSTFNYRQNRVDSNMVKRINNILKKNRKILIKYNPDKKSKVRRHVLEEQGFNFNFITNIYRTKKGTEYRFCYDYGYVFLEDNWIALVVKEEYVD